NDYTVTMRQFNQFTHAPRIALRSLIFGRNGHHEVESGVNGLSYPVIVGTLIENKPNWDDCGFGGGFSKRCVPSKAFMCIWHSFRITQEIAVEADNYRRACLLRRVDDPLQRFQVPGLEIPNRVTVALSGRHHRGNRAEWHKALNKVTTDT